jgi:hypothetical protein
MRRALFFLVATIVSTAVASGVDVGAPVHQTAVQITSTAYGDWKLSSPLCPNGSYLVNASERIYSSGLVTLSTKGVNASAGSACATVR